MDSRAAPAVGTVTAATPLTASLRSAVPWSPTVGSPVPPVDALAAGASMIGGVIVKDQVMVLGALAACSGPSRPSRRVTRARRICRRPSTCRSSTAARAPRQCSGSKVHRGAAESAAVGRGPRPTRARRDPEADGRPKPVTRRTAATGFEAACRPRAWSARGLPGVLPLRRHAGGDVGRGDHEVAAVALGSAEILSVVVVTHMLNPFSPTRRACR